MPPKSKKSAEKAKQKTIEDKTFGLKNKNRSAKVQAYCEQVTKNVRQSNRDEMKAKQEQEQRKQAKADKKAFEAAMSKLYAEDDDKKKVVLVDDDDEEEEEQEDAQYNAIQEYLWNAEDFDEVEFDPGRLEEVLEAEREKLKERDDLTKVTEETFKAWREKQKALKAAAEKKRLEKAKEGKGKLRGWDLWNEKKELFVDDDEGEEAYVKEFDDAALFEAGGDDDENDLEFE